MSTDQLQIASSVLANQDANDSGRDSPDRRSSPPVLNKKTGIEYWENFPLTSAAAIRRWQQDCEMHSSSLASSSSARPEVRGSSPASHLLPSDNARSKRRSLPGPPTSTSYPGSEASLDELFHMQNNRRTSSQVTLQRQDHMHMGINQQRPWQTQMMSMDPSHNDITQQQMFTNVGYLNASGAWTQQHQQQQQNPQHSMAMDIDHRHPTSHEAVPVITSQTHSHLFW